MRIVVVGLVIAALSAATAAATTMKPTAPTKMTSERDQKKMKECEARAAAENVPMNQRSKYVMDCMTKDDVPPY